MVVETAALIGLTAEPVPELESTLTCQRADGSDGVSYLLHKVVDVALPDVRAGVDQVGQFWTDMGYEVTERDIGGATVLSGRAPSGAVIELYAGPGGTTISGETLCATAEGRRSGA
ncbi:hypothetical protein [Actinotalea sp. JY-7876]|uniref:hypothetical protein n=1 Tax=Actinotalea sp. JY-7876 TaxID=2758442 RepID=UPI0015F595C0|nr:hypothetical protein [Actinotalea sp. JY-7876]